MYDLFHYSYGVAGIESGRYEIYYDLQVSATKRPHQRRPASTGKHLSLLKANFNRILLYFLM